MQLDGLNSALSPVVYGDIALSINTQYNTIKHYRSPVRIRIDLTMLDSKLTRLVTQLKLHSFQLRMSTLLQLEVKLLLLCYLCSGKLLIPVIMTNS